MEWIIFAAATGALWLYQLLILRKLIHIEARQKVLLQHYLDSRTRQSSTAHRRTSYGTPAVDARARTTRRDTHDLPATGRMSTAVHREKRDYDRLDKDN